MNDDRSVRRLLRQGRRPRLLFRGRAAHPRARRRGAPGDATRPRAGPDPLPGQPSPGAASRGAGAAAGSCRARPRGCSGAGAGSARPRAACRREALAERTCNLSLIILDADVSPRRADCGPASAASRSPTTWPRSLRPWPPAPAWTYASPTFPAAARRARRTRLRQARLRPGRRRLHLLQSGGCSTGCGSPALPTYGPTSRIYGPRWKPRRASR